MTYEAFLEELIERVMTEHWDICACPCTFCRAARNRGLRPRTQYPTNPKVSILYDGREERKPPIYDWLKNHDTAPFH